MRSIISSRGQITIPVAIRRALGLGPGTPVEFELRPDGALLRKRARSPDPLDSLYGILKGQPPVDELMHRLRGPGLASRRHPPANAPARRGRRR